MTNQEKIQILENIKINGTSSEDMYYEALEQIGDMKYHYSDYATTEPIDCCEELKRVPKADYNLCCAILTMLLREDHFCNGTFEQHYRNGEILPIIDRMIALLSE